mgnify:CR=1 FL=1
MSQNVTGLTYLKTIRIPLTVPDNKGFYKLRVSVPIMDVVSLGEPGSGTGD